MTTTKCSICKRQLKDSDSIARGFGPECATRRAAFLSSCGTTDAELATLTATCPEAAKWIRNFGQDMSAGRTRQARQCLDIARRQAERVTPAIVNALPLSEAEPVITVREIARGGYYVRTPFKLAGFVSAFKAVVGGTWHPEKEEWYVPASQLSWTVGALEYWFGLKVQICPANSGL